MTTKFHHKVLVVDDNENLLEAIAKSLDDICQCVLTAQDAEKGREILEKEHVSIVLSDLLMPGVNGLDFIKGVKEQWPHVLCILLTGYGDKEICQSALDLGVFDYLEKPFRWDMLVHRIRNALIMANMQEERDLLLTKHLPVGSVNSMEEFYKLSLNEQIDLVRELK